MRASNILLKTKHEAPRGELARNAQLLIRAGYIHKEMAGVYDYLPLGLRTLNKIINIIREKMHQLGAQEILMSSLQNPAAWQASGRWEDEAVDIWFKTKLKNGSEVGLANTHEEALSHLLTSRVQSHKDLPLYWYQFQTKFRNELRAKSGIMRTREFIMKDLYSFSVSTEQHEKFYEKTKQTYMEIFDALGIGEDTYLTFASGGSFSKYSHEFQTICPAGEDVIYLDKDKRIAVNEEVYTETVIKDLDLDKARLEKVGAAEVGNIFSLGTKYSEALGLFFTDANGKRQPVVMGSYGIGPGRVMGVIVEKYADDNGLVWPEQVAPFKYYLIGLGSESAQEQARAVYEELVHAGTEVLFDDRDLRAGEKLKDSDLVGSPYRLVISDKTGEMIEYKSRTDKRIKLLTLDQLKSLK